MRSVTVGDLPSTRFLISSQEKTSTRADTVEAHRGHEAWTVLTWCLKDLKALFALKQQF